MTADRAIAISTLLLLCVVLWLNTVTRYVSPPIDDVWFGSPYYIEILNVEPSLGANSGQVTVRFVYTPSRDKSAPTLESATHNSTNCTFLGSQNWTCQFDRLGNMAFVHYLEMKDGDLYLRGSSFRPPDYFKDIPGDYYLRYRRTVSIFQGALPVTVSPGFHHKSGARF